MMRSDSERVTATLALVVAAGMPSIPLERHGGPVIIYADRRYVDTRLAGSAVGYTWEIWTPGKVSSVTASLSFRILDSNCRLAIWFWRAGFAAPHRTLLNRHDTLTLVAHKMIAEMAQRIETARIAHALR
jgi:hypothetical protein